MGTVLILTIGGFLLLLFALGALAYSVTPETERDIVRLRAENEELEKELQLQQQLDQLKQRNSELKRKLKGDTYHVDD